MIEPQLSQLYIDDSFYQFHTDLECKEKRQDSQTSQQVNNLAEVEEFTDEQTFIVDRNIQTLMFSGNAVDKIIEMLKRSNRVQKNKGDIAETVSFTFTCFKGPDGKYIRNYICNGNNETVEQTFDQNFIVRDRCINFSLIFSINIGTQINIEDYKKFQETEYYKALQPENDFIKSKYSISSNIPAVDNSVLSIFVEPQKLLLVVRQDKIGYTNRDIYSMIVTSMDHLLNSMLNSAFFDRLNSIDVIYTLAWSRKKENKKQSPTEYITLFKLLLTQIQFRVTKILQHPDYDKLRKLIKISYFAENCLGEQVINDSISIYKELEQQHQGFKNIYENLQKLLKNKEFKKICDTQDYQLFLPDKYYSESINDTIKLIKLIPQPLLIDRMLKGLQNLQNIIADNRELQEISVSEQ